MLILEEGVLEVILSAFINELQPAINGKLIQILILADRTINFTLLHEIKIKVVVTGFKPVLSEFICPIFWVESSRSSQRIPFLLFRGEKISAMHSKLSYVGLRDNDNDNDNENNNNDFI